MFLDFIVCIFIFSYRLKISQESHVYYMYNFKILLFCIYCGFLNFDPKYKYAKKDATNGGLTLEEAKMRHTHTYSVCDIDKV